MNALTTTLAGLALAATALSAQAAETKPLVPFADEPALRIDIAEQGDDPATYRYTVSFSDWERGTVERRSFTSSHEYFGKSSYCYKGQFFVLTANDWEDTMTLAVIDWSKPYVLEEEWLFDFKAHKVIEKMHEDRFRHKTPVPYMVWHNSEYEGSPQGVGLKLGENPRAGCTLRWHYDAATGETRIADSTEPADRQPSFERRQQHLAWEDVTHTPAPLRGPDQWNEGRRYMFEGAGEAEMAAFRHALSACATLELKLDSLGREEAFWTRRVTGKELRAILDNLAAVPQWYTCREMEMFRGHIHPANINRGYCLLDAQGRELPLPALYCSGEYLPKPLLSEPELVDCPLPPDSFFPYPPQRDWEKLLMKKVRATKRK